MADNVTLSSALRTNLLSLQKTGDLTNRTNSRLSTGLKVASAIDDAVAYFQAKGLSDRAGDLTVKKDSVDQGVSTVKSAITGLEAIEKILVQMKGVALSAKSAVDDDRDELQDQFATLATQLNNVANDTSYQGHPGRQRSGLGPHGSGRCQRRRRCNRSRQRRLEHGQRGRVPVRRGDQGPRLRHRQRA